MEGGFSFTQPIRMSSRAAKGVVKLPGKENGSREWTQQGQETNKGPGSDFLRLQQMFVGGRLLHTSLVIMC